MDSAATVLAAALVVAAACIVVSRLVVSRRAFGTPAEQAAFAALHTVSLAAPPLRDGLTPDGARRSARHLRTLLQCGALAVLAAPEPGAPTPSGLPPLPTLLAWDGEGGHHAVQLAAHAAEALASGRVRVVGAKDAACEQEGCRLRHAVIAPLHVADLPVGTLVACTDTVTAGFVRAVSETARWMSAQLALAELGRSQDLLMEAQLRALQAQISPHFVYNALTAIASFVRTDPDRARDLLLEFADYTRYSLRRGTEFSSLAEELHAVDQYLLLERARFGDRLQVTLRVAPEVLPVSVPFLCLQPLVENAVKHGLERRPGVGRLTILVEDAADECRVSVEDDGVGMDPEALRRLLSGGSRVGAQVAGPVGPGGATAALAERRRESVGLVNVDERLRACFGDAYGLVVETAPGAGTKVVLRVPKFRTRTSVA